MVPDDPRRRPVARGRLPRRRVRAHRLAADLRGGPRRHRRRAAEVGERARRARSSASACSTASRRTSASTRAARQRESWEVARPLGAPGLARPRGRRRAASPSTVPFPGRDVVAQVWTAPGRANVAVPPRHRRRRRTTPRTGPSPRGSTAGTSRRGSSRSSCSASAACARSAACGHRPNVLHLNEGHTAFAALQLIAQVERRDDVPFDGGAADRGGPDGLHDPHAGERRARLLPARARRALPRRPTPSCSASSSTSCCALGRYRPDDPTDTFCPTVLALRLVRRAQRREPAARRGHAPAVGRAVAAAPDRRGPDRATSPTACTSSRGSPRRSTGSWTASSARSGARSPASPSPGRRCSMPTTPSCGTRDAPRARGSWPRRGRAGCRSSGAGAPTPSRSTRPSSSSTPTRSRSASSAGSSPTSGRRCSCATPTGSRGSSSDPDRPSRSSSPARRTPTTSTASGSCSTVTDFAQQRGLTRRLVFIEDFDLTADRALVPGRRPVAEHAAAPARGVRHRRDEGGRQRRAQPQHARRLVGRGLERRDARRAADRLVHRHRRHLRGPRRCRTRSTPSRSTTSSSTTSCRGSTIATSDGHPAPVARVGPPVDGDARRDLALAPHGRAVRRRPLPAERGPRGAAPDQRRDARATTRRHARPRRPGRGRRCASRSRRRTEAGRRDRPWTCTPRSASSAARDVTVDLWVMPPDAPPYPVAAHYLVGPGRPGRDGRVPRRRSASRSERGVVGPRASRRRGRAEPLPPRADRLGRLRWRPRRAPSARAARARRGARRRSSRTSTTAGVQRTASRDAVVAVLESLGVRRRRARPRRRARGAPRARRRARRARRGARGRPAARASVAGRRCRRGSERSSASSSTATARRGAPSPERRPRAPAAPWTRPARPSAATRSGASSCPAGSPAGYHVLRVALGRADVDRAPARAARGRRARALRRRRGARSASRRRCSRCTRRAAGAAGTSPTSTSSPRSPRRTAPSVVATLPLLAGFGPAAFEPSPYLPVSRLFWHERWLDVDARGRRRPRPPRSTALAREAEGATQRRGRRASHPYVDGAGSLRAKRAVLDAARSRRSGRRRSAPRRALDAFLADRPDGRGLRAVPRRGRAPRHRLARAGRGRCATGASGPTTSTASVAGYHALRPVARRRTSSRALAERLRAARPGPLARPPARRAPARLRRVAAPRPVPRGPLGRRAAGPLLPAGPGLGLPAASASPRARADGHALFRAAIVHHLNVAGMLRIDHVLGTQRLFCVPDGADAARRRLRAHAARGAARRRRDRGAAPSRGDRRRGPRHGRRGGAPRDAARRDPTHLGGPALDHAPRASAPFVPPTRTARSRRSRPTTSPRSRGGGAAGTSTSGRARPGRRRDRRRRCARGGSRERARLATSLGVERRATTATPPAGLLAATHRALAEQRGGASCSSSSTTCSASSRRSTCRAPRPSGATGSAGPRCRSEAFERRTGGSPSRSTRSATTAPVVGEAEAARGGEAVAHDLRRHAARRGRRGAASSPGRHARLFDHLGAHPTTVDGVDGTYFAVWAPSAAWVEVVGDFNGWDGHRHPLARRGASGIWEGFVPDVGRGRALQVPPRLDARRGRARQGRPLRASRRAPAADRLGHPRARATSGATRRGWPLARRRQSLDRADLGLRGAPRLVAARPRRPRAAAHLPRARAAARSSTSVGSASPTSSCCR